MFSPAPVSAAAQLAVHLGGGGQIAKAVGEVFLHAQLLGLEGTSRILDARQHRL